MARLSDYGIHMNDFSNVRKVSIRGHMFPVAFTMETMEYISDVYDADYSKFEADTNAMFQKKSGQFSSANLTANDLKIMRALIYGMLRTGGLEETPETIFALLGMGSDVLAAYGTCAEIFSDQMFQVEDLKKSKKPQDFQKIQPKRKKNKKNRK
ncbi:hypothetical protein ACOX9P_09070 [Enterococcus durans]|uniref:hypothetical protein n=1 Tax=Enterococcus durans TaxID=53345 RepID=UPI003BEEB5D4